MFCMLAEIWKDDRGEIRSKADLYKKFILKARESNLNHKQGSAGIEIEQQLKMTGYLAFYYMFCDIDVFDEEIIDRVSSSEKNYPKELLERVLKTKIFSEKQFIHRTIAEFALANYISNYKLFNTLEIGKERIKILFVKEEKIPTELRGTYAWLCSLSGDQSFIEIDPYYQAIHGDNSVFNDKVKKRIITAVRGYSETTPYFYSWDHKMELEGFYSQELDDFLIEEYDKGLTLKNHYIFFITNIIAQGHEVSNEMKEFCKKKLEDNSIPEGYRKDFIKLFSKDSNYLKTLLDRIKIGKVLDEGDNLKENILKILYPKYINHIEVADYLMGYTADVLGYCMYLYNTEYKDKYDLIDKVYKLSDKRNRRLEPEIPRSLKSFIKDYFLETFLKYGEELSAKEIFFILEHFNSYYPELSALKAESYRYAITDKVKCSEEKLQRLANELFEIFLDKRLEGEISKRDVYLATHDFRYFFTYKLPNDLGNTLLSRMDKKHTREVNLQLFLGSLSCLKNGEECDILIEKMMVEYGFEMEYEKWLNPEKQDWEINREKINKERFEKNQKNKEKNEMYFNGRSDDEIRSSFGDLNYITDCVFIKESKKGEKYLEPGTLLRLKEILKQAIYTDLIKPELLTLNSLAKNSSSVKRKIDYVYYTSLALNDDEVTVGDVVLKKYLYINALYYNPIGNVIKSDFIEQLDNKDVDLVKVTLKEYISLLLEFQFLEIKRIVQRYIEVEKDIRKLKKIALSYSSNLSDIRNSIFRNFIKVYPFKLNNSQLQNLKFSGINKENEDILEALITFNDNEKEKFTRGMCECIYSLIPDYDIERYQRFKNYKSELKIKIIDYMISTFNTERSLELEETPSDCAWFLRGKALECLTKEELEKLSEEHLDNEDIWRNRILNKISERKQKESDTKHGSYGVEEIKGFILNNTILSEEDFFAEVVLKIEKLKQEIEDNRNNEKKLFYHDVKEGNKVTGKTKKTEEDSRDIIRSKLGDKYDNELELTREKYEGDNRVDINIKYKKNQAYEVQVECKRDSNSGLYSGIQDQLIYKYFSSGIQHGIYLIFYFGDKNKEMMLKKVMDSIPEGYEEKIKVICIDLTY